MLGERLALLRKEKGLTQEELAQALNITRSALSLYEIGKRDPDTETLRKIAEFFNVTVDFLLGRTDIRNPEEKIKQAISDDPELLEFWEVLSQRDDLQLLFKQTKDISPRGIKRIIRIIKAIEEEEEQEP